MKTDPWAGLTLRQLIQDEKVWRELHKAVNVEFGSNSFTSQNLRTIHRSVRMLLKHLPNVDLEQKEIPMTTQSLNPHPHADILRAIADGKEIETRLEPSTYWLGCRDDYFFLKCKEMGRQFRIKPETKTQWLVIRKDGSCDLYDAKQVLSDACFKRDNAVIAQKEITYTPGEGLE